MTRIGLILLGLLALAAPAWAQVPGGGGSTAIVVATCGTPPYTFAPGGSYPLTQDTTGKLCDTGGTSGGVTSSNITQFGSSNVVTGAGAGGAGIPRVTVSNDSSVKVWDGTNTQTVKAASTAPVGTDPAAVVSLSPNSSGIVTLGQAVSASSVPVTMASNQSYPVPPTPTTAIATGTTGAVTATLAAVSAKTNYICGFNVSAIGGTAAVSPVTVTGLLGGTFTFQGVVSAVTGVNFTQTFNTCIPASTTNTAIAVVTTADGTATAVDVQSWGYVQ